MLQFPRSSPNAELHQCSKYHVGLSKIALYALPLGEEGLTETDLNTACAKIHGMSMQDLLR